MAKRSTPSCSLVSLIKQAIAAGKMQTWTRNVHWLQLRPLGYPWPIELPYSQAQHNPTAMGAQQKCSSGRIQGSTWWVDPTAAANKSKQRQSQTGTEGWSKTARRTNDKMHDLDKPCKTNQARPGKAKSRQKMTTYIVTMDNSIFLLDKRQMGLEGATGCERHFNTETMQTKRKAHHGQKIYT